MRVTILHTNDIHGHEDRIAQIATLVRRERERGGTVLYLDGGDVEESTNHLSNVTKGTAMHRLLAHAGVDAATVGNASWLRYGSGVLRDQAAAVRHPQLLANLLPVEGPVPHVVLDGVGIFGLTAPFRDFFGSIDWGFAPVDELEAARSSIRALRDAGAQKIVLLSHLGLDVPEQAWDDRRIAEALQGEVDLIIGAHSHDLLPQGEWVGDVLIAQAGQFGEHLGRIELDGGRPTAVVEAVPDSTPHDPAVAAEGELIAAEVEGFLAERIGRVDAPIDAAWIAELMRTRMKAEVGICAAGLLAGVVPAGEVRRGELWSAVETTANPGVTTMSGAQLRDLLRRGNDATFTSDTPRPLRGRVRGSVAVAGIDERDIDDARAYRVAATDWELEPYGGYALAEWGLQIEFDFPTIVREAVEQSL